MQKGMVRESYNTVEDIPLDESKEVTRSVNRWLYCIELCEYTSLSTAIGRCYRVPGMLYSNSCLNDSWYMYMRC